MLMPMRCHLFSVLSIPSTGLVAGLATPLTQRWDRKTVKHSWNAVPQYWESLGHPPDDFSIDLYLALKPQHESALIDTLHKVSNPRHAKYGAYLSNEQVAELVAPHPDTLSLVRSWLEDHGFPSSSVSMTLGGSLVTVSGVPVPQANDILSASYQLYHHVETNDTVVRTVSYSLPEAVHGHIQTVAPTTYFGSPHTQWNKPRPRGVAVAREKELARALTSRDRYVTPAYLRWLYKTMGYEPAAMNQNKIGVVGYRNQYPSPSDLRDFMAEFRTDGEAATYTVELVNGGWYDPRIPNGQANLNLQLVEAMTYPTPNIFYSTGGTMGTNTDPYVHWIAYMLGQTNPPQTITMSYYGMENEVPRDYAEWLCIGFGILGTRGVSIIFATGDWGVGRGDWLVEDSSGELRVQFQPTFPASCPWVTSVGGTMYDGPEIASSTSGGGFSNYFPRPPYQAYAVPPFLSYIGNTYQGRFNPYGRGLPDISAQAVNWAFVFNRALYQGSGTSGSTPTVAGIISLLNDYRISQGKPALGFLNPWLYSYGLAGVKDVRFGGNPGCGTIGFPATVGWDPVTGLGTPEFDKWEDITDEGD